jgi:predicted transglutaminase-like protease
MISYMFGIMGQYAPPKNTTTVIIETTRPPKDGLGKPNIIYEKITPNGSNYTFYDSDGRA